MDFPILIWHDIFGWGGTLEMRKERRAPPLTKGYEWRKRKGMFDSYKAAKQIALLRKSRGITQEELAQRLSVSPQAVSKWENGHSLPEVSILVELAEILRVTVDEILLPVGSPPANANFVILIKQHTEQLLI